MEGKCSVCNKTATNKCSKCHLTYYCSKDHQKDHWKIHKHNCMPVIVKEDKLLGRHLIASRSLKEGQIVFKEKPLVVGPSQITVPVCMGCCRVLTETTAKPCDRCGWPVCSDFCQKSPHHKPECDLTVGRGNKVNIQTFGVPHPNYQPITVLRCLYQKNANPIIWDKLMALESHDDHRKGTNKWKTDKIQIAQFIARFFKLDKEFTEEEIMKVCGIVQVNGHEVPLTEPPFVAVYDVTSMAEHNCRANCNKSFSSRGEVLVVAATDIAAGENITICYTDPLWGTANRRHHLLETKFFECSCTRCSDVTDLGTMLSAVRCQKSNCNGYVLPKTFITPIETENQKSTVEEDIEKQLESVDIKDSNINEETISTKDNPIKSGKKEKNDKNKDNENKDGKKTDNNLIVNADKSKSAVEGGNSLTNGNAGSSNGDTNGSDAGKEVKERVDWHCDKCGGTVNEVHVYKLMDHIGNDLEAMEKGSVDSCFRFLEHYGKYLHTNHYYMVDVTLALAQLIGQQLGTSLQTVTDERLQLKIKTCREMSELLEKLVPAELRARGAVMFELHAAVAEFGRREAARTGAGPPAMIKYLLESKDMLEKSIKYLEHEPEDLPEGKICKQAKINLVDMEAMIQNLFALDSPM